VEKNKPSNLITFLSCFLSVLFVAVNPSSFKMMILPQSEFDFPNNYHLQSLIDLINTIGQSEFKNLGVFLKSCSNGQNFTSKLKIEKIIQSNIATLKVKLQGEHHFTSLFLGSLKVDERARIIFSIIPKGKYREPFFMEFEEDVLCIHYAGIKPITHKT
jgi:hypothetical protein